MLSVGQGLIELNLGDRLRIRGIEPGGLIEAQVGLGWGAGRRQWRGSGGEMEMRENRANGKGIGNEGDDAHGSTTRRADERQGIIDARDEGGPS